ncbi:HNH endonuclease [Staphylococcus phage S-CoN_Ph10]|uniref:HNH endonuclease n=1 Tax=Staphylococcus phage CF9 TaxID=3113741 RepID=A0AAX4J6J4_9CAUD|nr:HNH endonuclease [Staphylococcus phage S-CoN_Ph1]WNM51579.1 HNH endonuclease [Staphylococcus phage S-CoN_Ph2]WNM51740.1 HNH endonuclease [Staphylococcus phage S-CoN_Ph3]WNM52023.1 HNH endonuclease [Staphylococcus phage S-CoN_Ph4]WNM52200.1 HNH endonuclease [Staphylococcus phage S-CoN_Ph5]WNM52706.1 HNH endonuclease [Staphylococcus phage S-CoN_Ph8]WNM52867.1 HNH endonuclease [Staphylococcus phage S-CoN_Ph9]WNM53037.1 HNH endonuclease [Staphylococcus phage S-CoN_Ph10]WNM53110.1 HNH endonuc
MRYKVCSYCGRRYDANKQCICQVNNSNEYSKQYYEQNKERKKQLNSKRWKTLRERIIKRDGGMCNRCWVSLNVIETKDLQVHHIKPRSEYPELMYDPNNLITVCKTCNLALGTKGSLDWEVQKFNEDIDEPRL